MLVHRTTDGQRRMVRVCRLGRGDPRGWKPLVQPFTRIIRGTRGACGTDAPTRANAGVGTHPPTRDAPTRDARTRVGIVWAIFGGGGVETVNINIAKELPRDGYIVDGICWRLDPAFEADAAAFDELLVLEGWPGEIPPRPTPPVEIQPMYDLVAERKYDILILSNTYGFFVAAQMLGIPVIEMWHGLGGWNTCDLPGARIVAVSNWLQEEIGGQRPRHAPVTVVHNGVDPAAFARESGGSPLRNGCAVPAGTDPSGTDPLREEARERFGFAASDQVVLYCGRFSFEKKPEDAMKAFELARRVNPALKLLMVGTIPEGWEEFYVRIACDVGLAWGEDLQHVVLDRTEIKLAYAAADVLVHPSEREGLAMVTLEAAAAGVPIISTFAGGSAEFLEGVAERVPLRDPEAMAASINAVLGSARKREMMRQAGLLRLQDGFTVAQQAEKLQAVIEDVLAQQRIRAQQARGELVTRQELRSVGLAETRG